MKRIPILALLLAATVAGGAERASRVVVVRDPQSVTVAGQVDDAAVRTMVAAGIKALAGPRDEAAAWGAFVSSNDVVGIKINAQPAPLHGTHRAVVEAIVAGVRAAGVRPENILVFDRDGDKMRKLGFVGCGVIDGAGWDAERFYENKLVGKLIWGDLMFQRQTEPFSSRSHLPKLLTQTITKLINVPVLMDHDACGVSGCLYNLSLGMVDNSRRFEMFNQNGDPAIAEIASMPVVRRKLVVNVMDALVGGFAGGPSFRSQYSWQPGAIYFSLDPVALDAVCLGLLEGKRKEAHVTPIGERAGHIAMASKAGLGVADPKRIELVELSR